MPRFRFSSELLHLWLCAFALLSILGPLSAVASVEFQLIHEFGKPVGSPAGKLIKDSAGNLYGTTTFGGSFGAGTIYKIDMSGNFSVLHNFDGANGGSKPYAGLLVPFSDGSFYGTTSAGGVHGYGTVYKLDKYGNFSIVHSFEGGVGGADPYFLVFANDGNFYGTTGAGGGEGYGTIFKLDLLGNFSIIHSFEFASGECPGELIQGIDGNLYGVTACGGSSNEGTIYKLSTEGDYSVLHEFGSIENDGGVGGGLLQTSDGNFYGVTSYGGSYGAGTLFKLDASGIIAFCMPLKGLKGRLLPA